MLGRREESDFNPKKKNDRIFFKPSKFINQEDSLGYDNQTFFINQANLCFLF
jgi:hypothetical protein